MHIKRVQLANYGPVESLDIRFPFDGEIPKPVVIVGENGSGKSILLSHIVNGLISAKGVTFPEAPEVESGKVYKLRSNSYIQPGHEHYFARVDYAEDLYVSELRIRQDKQSYSQIPSEISGTSAETMWTAMNPNTNDHYTTNFLENSTLESNVRAVFSSNCVLYFPSDRFEDPAWLNEENLNARAQHLTYKNLSGDTNRSVIALSPLRDNQDWLFGVVYDRAALETTTVPFPLSTTEEGRTLSLPVQLEPSGRAATIYQCALQVVRTVMCSQTARFGIGPRQNRVVSLEDDPLTIVPNVFQLSSGETSLLNLFLSILRDFDLSGSALSGPEDIRGVVVVDEIDLHLHTHHQYEILPALMQAFPKIQFVFTTHSPLVVLGINRVFEEGGFALYSMPQGQQISPEEFSEFEDAYRAFAETRMFNDDVRKTIEESQKPIVFLEGSTDIRYINKASELLGKVSLIEGVDLHDGGGSGKLTKIWKDSVLPLTEILPQQVLLLFDCDTNKPADNRGKLSQRTIPLRTESPIKKGIENLFSKATLEKARQYKPTFFTTAEEHGGTDEDGQEVIIPEKWTVKDREKSSLCAWLCDNGTYEDFKHFQIVFDLIEDVLSLTGLALEVGESEATP